MLLIGRISWNLRDAQLVRIIGVNWIINYFFPVFGITWYGERYFFSKKCRAWQTINFESEFGKRTINWIDWELV